MDQTPTKNSMIMSEQDNKINHDEDDDQQHNTNNPSVSLDLNLSSSTNKTTSLELINLIDGFDHASSSSSSSHNQTTMNGSANPSSEQRVFSCNYCQRKFYSSQALGGHQNAHKRERTLAKRSNGQRSIIVGNHHQLYHPYFDRLHWSTNMASLPLPSHGSNSLNSVNATRSLGIQAHSGGFVYGHPAIGKHASKSGGAGRFNSNSNSNNKGSLTLTNQFDHHQRGVGRFNWCASASNNIGSVDRLMINAVDLHHKEDIRTLDLSLKL